MGLAVGTGRVLKAPLKAKRPRGAVFYRLFNAATVSRNQEAGMAMRRGVIFIETSNF